MSDEYFYSWDIAPESDTTRATYGGKYWFDKRWIADVVMEEIEWNGDENWQVKLKSRNEIDITDYRPLARFLRWILRR
jgi:hypothetical protein